MALDQMFPGALAENLITLLAHSDEYGKLVASTVNPALFEGDMRLIADRCVMYWRQHEEAPKLHTSDLFADILEDPRSKRGGSIRRILSSMVMLNDGINADYVLSQLKTFVRMQSLKDAIFRSAEILNREGDTTIQDVEEILNDIMRARDFQFDAGIRLHDYQKLMSYLNTQYSEFDTGIPLLDKNNIVPNRGSLFLMLGGAGRGKTWGMIHLGKRALLRRKKVLHISPELSAEETLLRYYQSMFAASRHELDNIGVTKFVKQNGKLTGLDRDEIEAKFSFESSDIEAELQTRLLKFGGKARNLVIKRVSPRSMTVDGLLGLLDSLETVENWIPDMLIVDSAYLLKTDHRERDYRIALGRNYERLRGIGVDRNMAVVASHQLSKEGFKAARPSVAHIGEDWSIIQTADIALIYAATDMEQKYGLSRLYTGKVRYERGNLSMLLTQSYDIGQFVLNSMVLPEEIYFDMATEFVRDQGDEIVEDEEDDDAE